MSGLRVGEPVLELGVLGCYAERVAVPVANVVRSPALRAAMRPGDMVLLLRNVRASWCPWG
jgi:hypothetical protein